MWLWTADGGGGASPTDRVGRAGRTMVLVVMLMGGAADTPVGDGLTADGPGLLIWTTLPGGPTVAATVGIWIGVNGEGTLLIGMPPGLGIPVIVLGWKPRMLPGTPAAARVTTIR